ncbi:reverse transcriptase [Plakobranchus ocellatus]|uniref:Reverse transcriptase n=1 Tax=Plakobranchus ocellatus TaxID=259542 RepID=A0AAV3ZCP6_9GAST|nr:reverse transcriptase [Plakobranchus ocellatus]
MPTIFGAQQHKIQMPPRQKKKATQNENAALTEKKTKEANESSTIKEQTGLQALWRDWKASHSALSRAESAKKRQNQRKKTQENFFKNQFQFARQPFQQPRSGTITAQKEPETHLRKIYFDPEPEKPLEDIEGVIWPSKSGVKFNKPLTLD